MQSLWNDGEASALGGDPLKLRVHTSRLLGREPSLVLHGGGNTSVKAEVADLFGDREEILYIKGSGWDLGTIEAAGFAPVRLDVLRRMAELPALDDTAMVRAQRAAMTDPGAPTPSVEAILHAIIPFRFVDHTHADAVVAVSNTDGGEERIREVYGDRVLIIPYVMPGFVLARTVFQQTRDLDWSRFEGMVLLHHGIFSWGEDARTSYEGMIALVTEAENYLKAKGAWVEPPGPTTGPLSSADLGKLARLRREASLARGRPVVTRLDGSPAARAFASRPDVAVIATRGPLTPDHVIRTKPVPAILSEEPGAAVTAYAQGYREYFSRHQTGQTRLDPSPRWVLWPGRGSVALGATAKDAGIITDIARHTMRAIGWAESLGGWRALPEKDLFEVEYWELEQAKLKSAGTPTPLQGKVALVTGAASGIGRAAAEMLMAQGAAMMALDVNPEVEKLFSGVGATGLTCDVTDAQALRYALESTIVRFGGLDIVVSNAGLFTPTRRLEEMTDDLWRKSLDLNLTSHQVLFRLAIPYLRLGFDPTIIIVASKNVPAPGPGAAAYSVAKAGLTQLARVAALELAADGIRVNVIHPHAVFDTAAWTSDVLEARAKAYGMTVDQYRRNNLLGVEVRTKDVAALICAMAGPVFAKTTGAQVPIDGGSERVV
jgi:rhamnose utilization protein RhaD (predicted bifunctional aldolase and dehydrogenase)/NAD(P)-dependent dehydrogenase (short-subunit alcohol dehydrogenase family)